MRIERTLWNNPAEYLAALQPDHPVAFFAPAVLQKTAERFLRGFPGLVTYAVKANPDAAVLGNLAACGVAAFDVASPWEMDQVRAIVPDATLHYNNPVRSHLEIAHAVRRGVTSYSVDGFSELSKLEAKVPRDGIEIAVRFKLPVAGAAYDFGAKFGAEPEMAVSLLKQVSELGYVASLTFHPGTQCHDPAVWRSYLAAAGRIAGEAGVTLSRLNVGGGFPSHRMTGEAPDLAAIFAEIECSVRDNFEGKLPSVLCEPGRGMVGDAFSLATRVKCIRDDGALFLNDGIYGGLAEHPVIGPIDRIDVIDARGKARREAGYPRIIFGPTCDSVDKLPEKLTLPGDIAEGDYLIFHGLGAYSKSLATRFNGYGVEVVETVQTLIN